MGQEEVPGHAQTGGDGRAEGKGEGPEENGQRTAKSIYERILTVPQCSIRNKVVAIIKHNWLCSETDWKSTIFFSRLAVSFQGRVVNAV